MDAVSLSLFAHRIDAICEEMAASLKRSAFSPNIRDRLDFSCALFDAEGLSAVWERVVLVDVAAAQELLGVIGCRIVEGHGTVRRSGDELPDSSRLVTGKRRRFAARHNLARIQDEEVCTDLNRNAHGIA